MKKSVFIVFILFSFFAMAQVKWLSLQDALAAQKTEPRKIIIDFYADWCEPCKTMEKYTFNHSIISEFINNYYYPVRFNAEGNDMVKIYNRTFTNPDYKTKKGKSGMHEFTKYMNVAAVPSIIFLNEKSEPITILQGALSAKELEPYLPFFANNEYLKIKTRKDWENYQRKFKSKIKE